MRLRFGDPLLTIAAFVWVHRRAGVELAGLTCIVAAAWWIAPVAGLIALGIALILAANFAGR